MILRRCLCTIICVTFLEMTISIPGYAGTGTNSVKKSSIEKKMLLKDGFISADLKNTSLREILQQISKKANIWYKIDKTLLNNRVNVTFKNLPLEEGLKKILANFNYSLLYDSKKRLIGLEVLEKSKPAPATPFESSKDLSRTTTKQTTSERIKNLETIDQTTKTNKFKNIGVTKPMLIDPDTIPQKTPMPNKALE